MAAALKVDSASVQTYYQILKEAEGRGALHEGNVRRAFETLLRETAKDQKSWELVTEHTERQDGGGRIRYDGVLYDQWGLPHGHWEAKDTDDDLDVEIRKKRDKGYSLDNIIFEDTREAVLFQDKDIVRRADLHDPAQLTDLLKGFYAHEIEPFHNFDEAVAYFQSVIPEVAEGLKTRIEAAHRENKAFKTAFESFMELCKSALNPNISPAAVDEMLIQHMLTARLIGKIFTAGFTQRNVIAAEIEKVVASLTSPYFDPVEFIGALDRFYTAIEDAAHKITDFTAKQNFINHVYERFFQGYSVKLADTHGIVYTPQPIVDFMCAAVEEVLQNEFGVKLGDEGVYVIDPCTGTGNFAVNLLRRAYERNPRHFERFYREQLFANEVMLMPYYIASLNIEHEYYALTGHYESFEGICFVDTLDLAQGAQLGFSFMTEKNTERVERQKKAPITVIIGNPPYNVGQLNENDNNKNRKYKIIDTQVSETYAKDSKASNKNALSDPYVKFFRWAVDRLQGRDGIVCYVSNNSFVDQFTFDGMRKHLMQDFTAIYHLDLHGNVRQNPKLSGTTHNVFGIQVGVGITVAVRKNPHPTSPASEGGVGTADLAPSSFTGRAGEGSTARLFYHRVPEFWRKEEKLAYLNENVERAGRQNALNTVEWEELIPDSRNSWLIPEHADEFATFLPIGGKETKAAKGDVEAIFKTYSIGLNTARDSWIYDFNNSMLANKTTAMIEVYNGEVDRWRRSGKPKDTDSFVIADEKKIKWSSRLKETLKREIYVQFDKDKIRLSMYRPFTKEFVFFDHVLVHRQAVFPQIFPTQDSQNTMICFSGPGHDVFQCLISDSIAEYKFSNPANGGTQCFPFYVYDADGTNRRENITDWALAAFRERYGNPHLASPASEGGVGSASATPASEGGVGTADLTPAPFAGRVGEGSTGVSLTGQDADESEDSGETWSHWRTTPELWEKIKPLAGQMRRNQTAAEDHLWQRLRRKQIGDYKFRRQHVIDRFIVDFYCAEARLVIEVDGTTHEYTQEEDALRTAFLESLGLRVLRFTNGEVLQHIDAVVERIDEVLQEQRNLLPASSGNKNPHPTSPASEGGVGGAGATPASEGGVGGAGATPASEGGVGGAGATPASEGGVRNAEATPSSFTGRAGEGSTREIGKWDIFYYVYGLLHHPEYRTKFADNLKRELPRIPFAPDFWAFSEAGRKLADLHLNYETVKPYNLEWVQKPGKPISYRVEKMRLKDEKTAIQINDTLTLRGIPAEAFEYRLGNRSALDWVIDQYQVSEDKRSGIKSDPNGYSDDERYIVNLVERVVQVSVETALVVRGLAALAMDDQ